MMTSATPPTPYPSAQYNPYAGLTFVPRLPPTAYALLLHMLTQQQPGGHVRATHDELATGLALNRGVISRAMPYLVAARLILVIGRGRFKIHPMLALHPNPQERKAALAALAREDRLDVGHFEDEYELRLTHYLEEKARKKIEQAKAPTTRAHLRSVP